MHPAGKFSAGPSAFLQHGVSRAKGLQAAVQPVRGEKFQRVGQIQLQHGCALLSKWAGLDSVPFVPNSITQTEADLHRKRERAAHCARQSAARRIWRQFFRLCMGAGIRPPL
ncbi:hypothetical protein SDC9_167126 [bioreactor metagenome]|uniref:Uncharacterized protein n=1 Tax=bioreactor metagenome TaxID=1076179 RepID=A0A645G6M4_9ZZZZ